MAAVSSRTKRTVREFFREPVDDQLANYPTATPTGNAAIYAAVAKSKDLAHCDPEDLRDFGSDLLCLVDYPNGDLDARWTVGKGGAPC